MYAKSLFIKIFIEIRNIFIDNENSLIYKILSKVNVIKILKYFKK